MQSTWSHLSASVKKNEISFSYLFFRKLRRVNTTVSSPRSWRPTVTMAFSVRNQEQSIWLMKISSMLTAVLSSGKLASTYMVVINNNLILCCHETLVVMSEKRLFLLLFMTSRCATAPALVGAQVTPTGFLLSSTGWNITPSKFYARHFFVHKNFDKHLDISNFLINLIFVS